MNIRNFLVFGLAGLSLAACATLSTQSGVSDAVTKVQAVYADLQLDAAAWVKTHPSDAAVILKAELVLTPEIAALSGSTPPTTFIAVINNLNNQVQALPIGLVSQTTKSDLQTAVDAVNVLSIVGARGLPWVPATYVSPPLQPRWVRA